MLGLPPPVRVLGLRAALLGRRCERGPAVQGLLRGRAEGLSPRPPRFRPALARRPQLLDVSRLERSFRLENVILGFKVPGTVEESAVHAATAAERGQDSGGGCGAVGFQPRGQEGAVLSLRDGVERR